MVHKNYYINKTKAIHHIKTLARNNTPVEAIEETIEDVYGFNPKWTRDVYNRKIKGIHE